MKTTIKHVLISGAGSGLGFGLACRYLKRGIAVTALDLSISQERQNQFAEAAAKANTTWQFYQVDVTQADELKHCVSKAVSSFGPIDLAINSAGVVINKAFADTTPEDFKRVIDINLIGSFNFAAAVLPTLQAGARLALIASIAGLISNYAYSAYGASKFGVVGLATTLRYEYEHKGIRISCVCPPEVQTPMVAQEHASGNKVSLELKKFAGSMQADAACDQILAGLDAGQWMIIPSLNAKFLAASARYFPSPFFSLMKQLIKYTEKKLG